MKITDVRVLVHERDTTVPIPGRGGKTRESVLIIATDEGIEGYNFMSPPGTDVVGQIISVVKPFLLGRNPLDIGSIWAALKGRRDLDVTVHGYVDVALWDIAGKVAGLPVHRLLGTVRTEVPAYASSWVLPSTEHYVEELQAYREQGFAGYKIHPPSMFAAREGTGTAAAAFEQDLLAYRAVRAAAPDGYPLFADPFCGYNFAQAVRAGVVLQEEDFEWFEDPLPAEDLHGYVRLREKLTIPLLATELTLGGLSGMTPWVTSRATDYLRGDVVLKGGITGLMKIAHLAEAFGLNCEIHDAYNGLNNVATLNVAMAVGNCDWFEMLLPHAEGVFDQKHFSWGLESPITVDSNGMVHAPVEPGLGIGVDWDLVKSGQIDLVT